MPLQVIGAGVGRTGTYSLMLALNRLGLGPCHHMVEVSQNMPRHLPMWVAALNGHFDWPEIYRGYKSAVDWPTAGFFRELSAAYPSAKFVLTYRSPESWAQSFSGTIYKLLAAKDQAPPEMRPWLEMVIGVVAKTGFPAGLDVPGLTQAFTAHRDAVKAAVPADQLLIYEVKDGWSPLCAFLDMPVPDDPFPRTNDRSEFWDRISKL
jgi:hypothetical protein